MHSTLELFLFVTEHQKNKKKIAVDNLEFEMQAKNPCDL